MKIYLFIALLTSISCQSNDKTHNILRSGDSINRDSLKFTKLIEATINLPALQEFYKVQEILKQDDIVILESETIKEIRNLSKFNKPVRVLNINRIHENRIKAYIDFKSIKITNDTALIYYRYDIQGIGIKSSYIYQNGDWILINFHLWEN